MRGGGILSGQPNGDDMKIAHLTLLALLAGCPREPAPDTGGDADADTDTDDEEIGFTVTDFTPLPTAALPGP